MTLKMCPYGFNAHCFIFKMKFQDEIIEKYLTSLSQCVVDKSLLFLFCYIC